MFCICLHYRQQLRMNQLHVEAINQHKDTLFYQNLHFINLKNDSFNTY